MYIENVNQLSPDDLMNPELYSELIQIENEVDREGQAAKVKAKAKTFGAGAVFDRMWSAAKREYQKFQKRELAVNHFGGDQLSNITSLENGGSYSVGDWIADDDGVRRITDKGIQYACHQPILISRLLRNAETGKYKVEIKFCLRGQKKTIYAPREIIGSTSKIISLANDGVDVTSESAKNLVNYLADIQALNPDIIEEAISTSRLGWIDAIDESGNRVKTFLPYKKDVTFDNDSSIYTLIESIKPHGDREKWYSHVKEIRARNEVEININLAASFASVLVEPCGVLPFIVSFWGGTGIGKTVVLKLCTSVWADPADGKYITDPKATNTALEIRLNTLNSLPMTLDDMAQIKHQCDEDFSELIYRWCAGKGRDRSNKELGLNKLSSWRNCTITNGERSLVDELTQGGAVNRVIDIESDGRHLFDGRSGGKTTKLVENNYGFAGEEFIDVIMGMSNESLMYIFNGWYEKLREAAEAQGVEKEEKQIVPMALILTADDLIEKHLFKDGVHLDIDKCLKYLRNKGDVSEDQRAYDYLMDTIVANSYRFEDNAEANVEQWGFWMSENQIAINGTIFERIMKQGKFQGKAFLSWAKRMGLIECDSSGNPKKVVKQYGKPIRAVVIKTASDIENLEDCDDFKELPFK